MSVYLWLALFWVCGFAGGIGFGFILWWRREPRPSPASVIFTHVLTPYDDDADEASPWPSHFTITEGDEDVDEEYTWTRPTPGAANADSGHS